MANLLNLERVSKSYGVRPLLTDVSLGIGAGERIGIVGRNGDGKTTLLEVMTGLEEPDTGRVSRSRGLLVGYLHQGDELVDTHTVREAVLGGRSDHEWAADPRSREVVEELLAGVSLDRAVVGLSGGERRRCSLAALLLDDHDLIVLDEPTNHLDVEAVAWLARHLVQRTSALVVVTHDRWFLDAVCQWTWEVHDGVVDAYEGGYAAFVLAKAERQRQASASETRRQNLARKELAWLRRGAPARTSKPKFRIDAANALIEDVPPPRDRLELQRFAAQRLGKDVIDVEDVRPGPGRAHPAHARHLAAGPRRPGRHRRASTAPARPRCSTLVSGSSRRAAGRVKRGRTVALRHLTQQLDDLDPDGRVLPIGRVVPAGHEDRRRQRDHGDLDAGALRLHRRPADRPRGGPVRWGAAPLPAAAAAARRAQRAAARRAHQRPRHRDPQRPRGLPRRLARHPRRGLPRPLLPRAGHRLGLGAARRRPDLHAAPRRRRVPRAPRPRRPVCAGPDEGPSRRKLGSETGRVGASSDRPLAGEASAAGLAKAGSAEERAARKNIARIDKRLERIAEQEAALNAEVLEHAQDYEKLARLSARLDELAAEKDELELEWLEAAETLE